MKPPIPVVTDMHHPSAGGAVPFQDVEFPQGEVGILGPVVGHRADLPWGLRPVDRSGQPRGYSRRSRYPSPLKGRCQELLDDLPGQARLNVDETGHKQNGDRMWTWCFRAALYTLFKVDSTRSADVLI